MTRWNFEAEYFTACNCDWGCPCNFNAKPNGGRCYGWGVWHISKGRFGKTDLAGLRFAVYYEFPGPIEEGNGSGCACIDSDATPDQRQALEAIASGEAGGGIFELFGRQLISSWLPIKYAPMEFGIADGAGRIHVGSYAEADSELLSYPDGSTIRPGLALPHGIEYKSGLMTNTKRWRWSDGKLSAGCENRDGALARVKFTEDGCVG